jgi:hypothetical protein
MLKFEFHPKTHDASLIESRGGGACEDGGDFEHKNAKQPIIDASCNQL